MKFVRWKRYGFTHIVDERPILWSNRRAGKTSTTDRTHQIRPRWMQGWVGGFTVCGNWWHATAFNKPLRGMEQYYKGLLPLSEKDDEARPLCGTCKKHLKKMENK